MAGSIGLRLTGCLLTCTTLGALGAPGSVSHPQQSTAASRQYSRIVSLAPSNTELIYSLGAEAKLVGRSKFCDYPPDVKTKTVVGDFVSPNIERLTQAQPEIVLLVNGQETMGGLLKRHKFPTVAMNNLRIEAIPQNLRALGAMTATSARAEQLAGQFEKSVGRLRTIVNGSARPRVLFVAWPQPLITAGGASFVNDCITTSGGINVAASIKTSYPHLSRESLLMAQPDVIIFPHEAEKQTFWKAAPWTTLKAIKEKHFYFLPPPAEDGLSRPTLRVIDGLYWLSRRIHPQDASAIETWYADAKRQVTVSGVNR